MDNRVFPCPYCRKVPDIGELNYWEEHKPDYDAHWSIDHVCKFARKKCNVVMSAEVQGNTIDECKAAWNEYAESGVRE